MLTGFLAEHNERRPLPRRADSALHSRVASIASGPSRTGTPKIPPGFENLHAHPEPPKKTLVESQPQGIATESLKPQIVAPEREHSLPAALPPTVPVVPVVRRKSSLTPEKKPDIIPDIRQTVTESAIEEVEEETGQEGRKEVTPPLVVEATVPETPDVHNNENLSAQLVPPSAADTLSTAPQDQKNPRSDADDTTKQDATTEKSVDIETQPVRKASTIVEQKEPGQDIMKLDDDTPLNPDPTSLPGISDREGSVVEVWQPGTDTVDSAKELEGPIVEDAVVAETPVTLSRAATPPPKEESTNKRSTLRTLNVTTEMLNQHKRELASATPRSSTIEKPIAYPTLAQIRQSSRQPSLSMSRPSSPGLSELASVDVSRASSPPPSVFGSASARQKTKAQLKKERKEKAAKTVEASETGSVVTASAGTPTVQETVEPIVARQKKQKKQKSGLPPQASNTPIDSPTVEAPKEDTRSEETKEPSPPPAANRKGKKAKKEPSSPPAEPSRPPTPRPIDPTPQPLIEEPLPSYTVRDLLTDIADLSSHLPPGHDLDATGVSATIKDLIGRYARPINTLLAEMIATDDLDKVHPLLQPQSFNSQAFKLPSDSRKGQAYLEGNNYNPSDTFGYVYLPQKEKKALYQGHAVSVADSGEKKNDLLRRCLITPGGWVLRHLSSEESEKVLDLEEKRSLFVEEHGDLGIMEGVGRLEDDDYINLEGGFDELSRFGERHGVCWVVGENERAEMAMKRARAGLTPAQYARLGSVEDDYGMGDMPVNGNDYAEDDDLAVGEDFDDDEAAGEEMVLRAEADEDDDQEGLDFIHLADDQPQRLDMDNLPPMPRMPQTSSKFANSPDNQGSQTSNRPQLSSQLSGEVWDSVFEGAARTVSSNRNVNVNVSNAMGQHSMYGGLAGAGNHSSYNNSGVASTIYPSTSGLTYDEFHDGQAQYNHNHIGSVTNDYTMPPLPEQIQPSTTTVPHHQRISSTNTLAPMQGYISNDTRSVSQSLGSRRPTVNLRSMDEEALRKRMAQMQKESEGFKREADKLEKQYNKKAKDLARWRDSVFKSVGQLGMVA